MMTSIERVQTLICKATNITVLSLSALGIEPSACLKLMFE